MQEVGSQKTKLMQMFLFGIMGICLEKKGILAWQVDSFMYVSKTQTSGTYFQIH